MQTEFSDDFFAGVLRASYLSDDSHEISSPIWFLKEAVNFEDVIYCTF